MILNFTIRLNLLKKLREILGTGPTFQHLLNRMWLLLLSLQSEPFSFQCKPEVVSGTPSRARFRDAGIMCCSHGTHRREVENKEQNELDTFGQWSVLWIKWNGNHGSKRKCCLDEVVRAGHFRELILDPPEAWKTQRGNALKIEGSSIRGCIDPGTYSRNRKKLNVFGKGIGIHVVYA